MIYPLIRDLLFRLDAEDAHDFTTRHMELLQSIPSVVRIIRRWGAAQSVASPVRLWGLEFRNRLGIAAGFDKNAALVAFLEALGFGFVEVGTVTLRPQPGNSRPRLFRYPASRALINRLGFNNEGAAAVVERLRRLWNIVEQPKAFAPLFVNIGKNRDVALEDAPEEYRAVYSALAPLAHGIVINVSSPNTPGLRDLQNPLQIEAILRGCREERERLQFATGGSHPILVKIAPDLTDLQLEELVAVCRELADGIIATNTTIRREGLLESSAEPGGLSGRPLFARSTEILRRTAELAGTGYPLIGVGGVFSADDVRAKLDAGAVLVQAYTGFIYEGPLFARRVAGELRKGSAS